MNAKNGGAASVDDGNKAVTWLTNYEDVREAFKLRELRQASYDGAKDTVFADVLVTLDGERHGTRRRSEHPLFRPDMVAGLENAVVPAAAGKLIAQLQSSGETDLVNIARLISTAMAARIVGLDDCDTAERLEELSALMAKLHEGVIIEWTTRPREALLAEVSVARDRYRERFLAPSLARRENPAAGGAASEDLIQLLLAQRDALAMDPEKILRESVHYLVATAHTTATAIVHGCHQTWRWIAAHPEEREKCGDQGFVQACMNETLRLQPPSGWQFRIAEQDITLSSGRRIGAGEKLGLHLVRANQDPLVFGCDAEQFDPYRTPPRHVPPYGLAFGDGAHVCIGMRLVAGVPARSGASGVLAAIGMALFASGCMPHRTRPPVSEPNTERHQYRSYPVRFADPDRSAEEVINGPLAEVEPSARVTRGGGNEPAAPGDACN